MFSAAVEGKVMDDVIYLCSASVNWPLSSNISISRFTSPLVWPIYSVLHRRNPSSRRLCPSCQVTVWRSVRSSPQNPDVVSSTSQSPSPSRYPRPHRRACSTSMTRVETRHQHLDSYAVSLVSFMKFIFSFNILVFINGRLALLMYIGSNPILYFGIGGMSELECLVQCVIYY